MPQAVATKKRALTPPASSNSESQDSGPRRPSLEKRLSETLKSDISLDNLVEGSRRKRNKFSSDLPLLPLPALKPTPSFGHARSMSGARKRTDSSSTNATLQHTPYSSLNRVSFPTPAPTTISDEDVAMQLIRLGDPSLSPFKCPSENSSSPIPALTTAMQLKALHDGNNFMEPPPGSRDVEYPSSPPSSINEQENRGHRHHVKAQHKKGDAKAKSERDFLVSKEETDVEEEDFDLDIEIPRPQNLPESYDLHKGHGHAATPDGEDLPKVNGRSVGIRCTRCKKSKKGCDRQRPCGRCADANEDCVTEDESTGRRGRTSRGRNKRR